MQLIRCTGQVLFGVSFVSGECWVIGAKLSPIASYCTGRGVATIEKRTEKGRNRTGCEDDTRMVLIEATVSYSETCLEETLHALGP